MLAACIASAGLLLVLANPPAEKTSLGVFALSGNASVKIRRAAEGAIQRALGKEALEVMLEGAPIEDATVVYDCSANEPKCLRSIAQAVNVELILHGSLDRKKGGRLRLVLTLANADGRVLAASDAVVSKKEIETHVASVVRDLVARGVVRTRELHTVTFESVPSGADVFRSGKKVGRTPLQLALPPGSHLFELHYAGQVERRVVDVEASAVRVDITFAPSPPPPPPPPPQLVEGPREVEAKSSSWVAPGIVAGVGAVAVGTGAALLLVARGTQSDLDAGVAALASPPSADDLNRLADLDGLASRGTNQATAGYVVGGVGVALIAGAVVWGLVASDSESEEVTTDVVVDGAGARLSW